MWLLVNASMFWGFNGYFLKKQWNTGPWKWSVNKSAYFNHWEETKKTWKTVNCILTTFWRFIINHTGHRPNIMKSWNGIYFSHNLQNVLGHRHSHLHPYPKLDLKKCQWHHENCGARGCFWTQYDMLVETAHYHLVIFTSSSSPNVKCIM